MSEPLTFITYVSRGIIIIIIIIIILLLLSLFSVCVVIL